MKFRFCFVFRLNQMTFNHMKKKRIKQFLKKILRKNQYRVNSFLINIDV